MAMVNVSNVAHFSSNLPSKFTEEWELCIIHVDDGDCTMGWIHEDASPEDILTALSPRMADGWPDMAITLMTELKTYYHYFDGSEYKGYLMNQEPDSIRRSVGHDLSEVV